MDLDALILSRLQFAWVIGWHILLPAFTVGIASFIALLEGLKLVTGREVYVRISTFWIKIFPDYAVASAGILELNKSRTY